MKNSEKTISANSRGIVISYGDSNKHMFVNYQTPKYVEKIQLNGTRKYQREEFFYFTPVQKDLYQKTVYGFSAYSKEELSKMSKAKKFKIMMSYTKTQRLLNRWKQEIVNEVVDSFLLKMFPKSSVAKTMVAEKGYDDNIECNMSFRELGVSQKKVINKLIEFGMLPQNFFNLV